MKQWLVLSLIFLCSCMGSQNSGYQHVCSQTHAKQTHSSDYFVILYVDAKHLDYSGTKPFLKSLRIHPSVGHAWIYLQGIVNQQVVSLEGGHSGESGHFQAKYFDGVMNYFDFGYANVEESHRLAVRYEPNPIKYLWETQHDGHFQYGSGGHTPTYAVSINLSEAQFLDICSYIETYPYSEYTIINNQCCSFVAGVACIAGVTLDCAIKMPIENEVEYNGCHIRLWADPDYSQITFLSPDILERRLKELTEGKCKQIY